MIDTTTSDEVMVGNTNSFGGITREHAVHLRAATMEMLVAYERILGISPTTAEQLFWLKHLGPNKDTIKLQVDNLKECGKR